MELRNLIYTSKCDSSLNVNHYLCERKKTCSVLGGRFMVFNTTFNDISVKSWRRKPQQPEKTTEMPQVTGNLSHNVALSMPRQSGIQTTLLQCFRSQVFKSILALFRVPVKNLILYSKDIEMTKMPRCNNRNKEYHTTADTHFRVRVILIIEDPTVTMKCRTAI